MHLSCYQSGEMGMSAQWSISGFIFWESNLVTDYNRRMETVHGEALPNTVMFSVVWWLFLAGDKDSWRNLCPQALVLQLTSPSVLSTLFLTLHCNLEQQSHQAENKTKQKGKKSKQTNKKHKPGLGSSLNPRWSFSWPPYHGHLGVFWHYRERDRLQC